MMNDTVKTACSEQRYEIHSTDLPLSCPMPNTTLWDAHPKVFLDIENKQQVSCPYCGAHYVLADG